MITIITSTLNCREALEQTAASIREQRQAQLQWSNEDGGSTDSTPDVGQRHKDLASHLFLEGGKRLSPDSPVSRSLLPRVAVVTVVRNGAATIEACIQSVTAQTYPNVEHVIVDGISTDSTVDILRAHDSDIEYWVSEPDEGIYNALNKAIELIGAEWYVVLGCDDLLFPEAVEKLMRHARDSLLVFGQVEFFSQTKGMLYIRNHSAGVLISTEAHRLFGTYDESYRIAADTKFLSCARLAGVTKEIPDVVGAFFVGGASGNYRKNIEEHARAMRESGAWGTLRTWAWILPRRVRALFRSRASRLR